MLKAKLHFPTGENVKVPDILATIPKTINWASKFEEIDQWAGTWWFSCKPNCRATTNSQYIPMNSFHNCHFSKVGSIVKLAYIAIESTLCPYIPITSPCSLSSSHQFLHCQLRPFFRRRRRRAQRRPKHSGPRRKPWENSRRKRPEKWVNGFMKNSGFTICKLSTYKKTWESHHESIDCFLWEAMGFAYSCKFTPGYNP